MMVSRYAPLLAVLLLAACNSKADGELQGEGLSPADVAGMEFAVPLNPGQYRATGEVLEFSLAGLSAAERRTAEAALAEGAGAQHSYCLKAGATADQWLSSMNESACTVASFTQAEGRLDAVLQCSDPAGLNGRVEIGGAMAETGANMELRFTQAIADRGEAAIRMRVVSQRIGDCV